MTTEMTPERWQLVKHVFEAAVRRDDGKRSAYLDEACAGDPSLRAEVEAMLGSDGPASTFMETPVAEFASELIAGKPEASRVGSWIGRYRLLSALGAGGMGEVYLAEDSSLARKVALKVLAPALAAIPASRARFVREARLASALEHTNICTVYEVGEAQGAPFISMQYIEGDTLHHRVSGCPLSVEYLLPIALQVADALSVAHARGIVHRDIKSSNVMVTPSGQVKVVDFGISKLLDQASGVELAAVTKSGALFGTPSCMSPEQARGERVDHRSDIFSFGTLLYEMATGQVPFCRRSIAETMNAVINDPHPCVREINARIPSRLVNIIDRALAKDPAERYQSIDDLRSELRAVAQELSLAGSGGAESAESPAILPGPFSFRKGLGRSQRRKSAPTVWRAAFVFALAVMLLALIGPRVGRLITRPAPISSIAVFPFVHRVASADLEYLAEGIGESVTDRLSQLPQLRVMARSTMVSYQGRNVDPRAAGRELGVEAVVTGQLVQEHDRIVARLELVDVKDGSRLWGGEYSRRPSELFALPGDLALAVSRELHVRVTGQQERTLRRDYTRNADAYQQYLRGLYFWNKRTADAVTRSIDFFKSAIDIDPTFALAYSGLADAHLILRGYGMRSSEQSIPQARAAAEHALKLDESIAEAHTSLGQVRTHSLDWAGAEAAFQRAIELNPNYATAHHWQAMYLANVGRLSEAMVAMRRAQALDPLSLIINTEIGRLLYFSRQYDAAIAQYSRTLELDPNFALAHLHLGSVLVEKGSYAEAIAEFQKASPAGGPMPAVGVIRAYARAGRHREAVDAARQLLRDLKTGFMPPYAMAVVHASIGDHEQAIGWLERGVREGGAWFLTVTPHFDVLRSDPRFQAVVRRAGLTP